MKVIMTKVNKPLRHLLRFVFGNIGRNQKLNIILKW